MKRSGWLLLLAMVVASGCPAALTPPASQSDAVPTATRVAAPRQYAGLPRLRLWEVTTALRRNKGAPGTLLLDPVPALDGMFALFYYATSTKADGADSFSDIGYVTYDGTQVHVPEPRRQASGQRFPSHAVELLRYTVTREQGTATAFGGRVRDAAIRKIALTFDTGARTVVPVRSGTYLVIEEGALKATLLEGLDDVGGVMYRHP